MTRVGITGHQRLETPNAWIWVESMIRIELSKLRHPIIGLTSLAVGADQLFARLVLEENGTVHAVLPFEDIERSFSAENVPAFRELISKATVEILDSPGSDEDAYLAAGQRVVDLSDLIFAVWDGKSAKGKGGTADIVAYSQVRKIPIVHFHTAAFVVRYIQS